MKKWLILLGSVLVLTLVFTAVLVYLRYGLPSDETVKREFLRINPGVEVVEMELIFDDPPRNVLLYSVKYKKVGSGEAVKIDFGIKRGSDLEWRWCDDRTERRCE